MRKTVFYLLFNYQEKVCTIGGICFFVVVKQIKHNNKLCILYYLWRIEILHIIIYISNRNYVGNSKKVTARKVKKAKLNQ